MYDRTAPTVADSVRRLLPVNHGPWTLARTRNSIHERTVRLGAIDSSPIDPKALWEYGTNRSRGRHAHGFTFVADWLGAAPNLDEKDAADLSELMHGMILAWNELFGMSRDSAPEMAFHDETTAQRLLGVVGMLDRFTLTDKQRADLTDFARQTAAILIEPDFYGGVNNHGMFQDLALLAWSSIVATADDELGDRAWELAADRLHAYFSTCFTAEGVHVENTPTYHVMVARYLPILSDLFVLTGSAGADLYDRLLPGAVEYAVHSMTPEALYPPVSDTHHRRLDTAANLSTFPGGEFEYAATGGARGKRPDARTKIFPTSGYAMTRSAWGDPDATFVHFVCAYNADYHKHSDELSIYLRSGGRDLLCEAGPYGYNWRDPFTKYAYSSAAHNSLVIGGTGLPRTEPQFQRDKGERPMNALEVRIAQDDETEVIGTTCRFRGRVWCRNLNVRHGAEPADSVLAITDTIRSEVGSEDLTFFWHMGPGLTVNLRTAGAEVFDGTEKVMEIEFRAESALKLRVVEGSEEPSIQGWYFPDFGQRIPAPVILLAIRAADLTLTTEVRLSDFVWTRGESRNANDTPEPVEFLNVSEPALETWSSLGSSRHGVLIITNYADEAHRDRLVAELAKSDHTVMYMTSVVGLTTELKNSEPERVSAEIGTEDTTPGELPQKEVVQGITDLIRSQTERGVQMSVATVGKSFGSGAIAALETEVPLIAFDPALPYSAGDARGGGVEERISELVSGRQNGDVEVVSSGDSVEEVGRSLRLVGSRVSVHHEFNDLLRADVEDSFSGFLANILDAKEGNSLRYFAVYDRVSKEFILEVPDAVDAEVSVRVFHGKKQMHAMPYALGAVHRIAYDGVIGPHRLRVHIRGSRFAEPIAFTTTAVRVR